MAVLDELFRRLREAGGSDLHLGAELEPRWRLHGRLEAVPGASVLSQAALRGQLRELVSADQWKDFESSGDLDFSYGLRGVARFRANYFQQSRGVGAVFRMIPDQIQPLESLGLPPSINRLVHAERGLVLVTGPTGSGKSTTLAAIVDKINEAYDRHIVTIEDPVEFVYRSKRSVFSQREVGTDTDSFAAALRAALRQDPDVILVGEMRDHETISLALSAAEMGSLVFATLHTNGAAHTLERLVETFPDDERQRIRLTLADSLTGVVSQLLLPTPDGQARVPACEILLRARGLGSIIREGNVPMIESLLQSGRKLGMQTLDDSLAGLVESGRITEETARLKARDKGRFVGG